MDTPTNTAWDNVLKFFQEEDWKVDLDESDNFLFCGFSGENGIFRIMCSLDDDLFQCFSNIQVIVPEAKRMAIAQTITLANYGIRFGNFEMDYEAGDIRFRTSAPYVENLLPVEVIRHSVFSNAYTTDHYIPAIMSVIYGNILPAEAIKNVDEEPAEKIHSHGFQGRLN